MIDIIRWAIKACTAGIISIGILSLLSLPYSHSGVHIISETGATDYKWESGQFRSNMEEGFSWLKMNKEGFNNSFDLEEGDCVDILLMGSSHMEAVNVAGDRNTGFLLNEMLPDTITYNIGISGHTIYRCANNLGDAVACYNPQKYIIIETDSVDLEESLMKEVIDHTLSPIPSHDQGIMYAVQKYVPCVLPLYRQLVNWISASVLSGADALPTVEAEMRQSKYDDGYMESLDRFIGEISSMASGRKVIIIYHPDTVIDETGNLEKDDEVAVQFFQEACDGNGITFISMYEEFETLYTSDHKLAHGFSNTAVGYGHLNDMGHVLIARRLADEIRILEDVTE